MEKKKPVLEVKFYKESNGNEPVKKWLRALDKPKKKIVGDDIKKVQHCWPIGMPLVRGLGDGLSEVRSNFPDGIMRIIFIIYNSTMILLHGLIKKTERLPKRDLNLAKERARNYEKENKK